MFPAFAECLLLLTGRIIVWLKLLFYMTRFILPFLLLLLEIFFNSLPGHAQSSREPIDQYFNQVSQLRQLNGNILLANDGNMVYSRTMGYADMNTGNPNQIDSRFNLASLSKIFTATAILQLKEKRKLTLEDAVNRWLPELPYSSVTLRHLLTHTSGIADLELFESLIKKYPDTVVTNLNIIPELKNWKRGLYFTPGDKFLYCNTEYSLLAMVVEKASGMSFPAYLQKHILQPAGMASTYVDTIGQAASKKDPRLVTMHIPKHPFYDTAYITVDSIKQYKYTNYNCSGLTGQSNLVSTITDLLLFDKAYFGGKLLKPATMQEAFTPIKLNNGEIYFSKQMDTMDGEGTMSYGLGWEIFEQPGRGWSVGHGGFKFGLATFYCHTLKQKQSVITFNNAPNSEFGRIVTSSLSLLNGEPPLPLRTKKSVIALYGTTLVKDGANKAIALLNTHKTDTLHYYLNEWEMNELGYDLFYKSSFTGHKELALEVFKIATLVFPNSFNTYDSYGQLLKDSGQKEAAILMYQKSIELNPGNEDGKKILKGLLGD
jgi:CubicO group peptidase (beta-lactamase class C family)